MKAALLAMCLVGCNQVFDLTATVSIDAGTADVDGDGVADDVDNCPTLVNADQLNSDGDSFGDACDSCALFASSSVHDEDRDRLGDDCDPCPGAADFGVDGDGDGVGDLCDPTNRPGTPDHRVVFEPFVALPSEWTADTVAWSQSTDAIAPVGILPAADLGLRNTAITTAGTWMATIGLESRTHWDGTDKFSIAAVNGTHRLECRVTCTYDPASDSVVCRASALLDGAMQFQYGIAPRPSLQLTLLVKTPGSAVCLFGDAFSTAFSGGSGTNGLAISITASPRIRVTYFDYIH